MSRRLAWQYSFVFRISLVCFHLLPQICVGVFINVAHNYVLMIRNRSQVNLARIGICFTWPAFILWKNRAAIRSPASSTSSLQNWLEDYVLSLKFMIIFQVMGMFNQLALAVISCKIPISVPWVLHLLPFEISIQHEIAQQRKRFVFVNVCF